MKTGKDVQQWVLIYKILFPKHTAPRHAGQAQYSLRLTCDEGIFKGINWSPSLVMDLESLEGHPIPLTLDEAIRTLNDAGVTGGFSTVKIMWPIDPRYGNRPAYAFSCPVDQVTVGLSAENGVVLWKQPWSFGLR